MRGARSALTSVCIAVGVVAMQAGKPLSAGGADADRTNVLEHFAASDAAFHSSDWAHRFHLDVDGDGLEELFVSHDSTGGNAGEGWRVYSPNGDGAYRFLGGINFHRLAFRLVEDPIGIDTYWRYGGGTGTFLRYALTDDGFEPVEGTGEIAADSVVAQERFEEMADWREKTKLVYYTARIDGLLRGGETWLRVVRQGRLEASEPPLLGLGQMELDSSPRDEPRR